MDQISVQFLKGKLPAVAFGSLLLGVLEEQELQTLRNQPAQNSQVVVKKKLYWKGNSYLVYQEVGEIFWFQLDILNKILSIMFFRSQEITLKLWKIFSVSFFFFL